MLSWKGANADVNVRAEGLRPRVQGTQCQIGWFIFCPLDKWCFLALAREGVHSLVFKTAADLRPLLMRKTGCRQLVHDRLFGPQGGLGVSSFVPVVDGRQRLPVLGRADEVQLVRLAGRRQHLDVAFLFLQ